MTEVANDMTQNKNQKQEEQLLSPVVLELLTSRICHDIISPVGAVHNGVEFLQEMGVDAGQDAIDLIAYSAKQASAKLQVFRMAYGSGGRDSSIKPEDVYNTFQELIEADKKIVQEWDPHGELGYGDDRPDAFCKTLIGALILATECMPKGGTIKVTAPEYGTTILSIEGPNAAPRQQVGEALDSKIDINDIDPRLVHPYALGILARHYNYDIGLNAKEIGKLEITLSLPV